MCLRQITAAEAVKSLPTILAQFILYVFLWLQKIITVSTTLLTKFIEMYDTYREISYGTGQEILTTTATEAEIAIQAAKADLSEGGGIKLTHSLVS